MRPTLAIALFAALGFVAPALAQDSTGAGSLAILSRPAGAAFRVRGAGTFYGRAPVVIARGLVGHVRIECVDPRFHGWTRELNLTGAMPDTVWMTLRTKHALGAGVRSLVFPGWGQFDSGRPSAGGFFLIANLVAGAGLGTAAIVFQQRLDRLHTDEHAVASAVTPAETATAAANLTKARSDVELVRRWRRGALGTLGVTWGLNLLESVVRFPRGVDAPVAVGWRPAIGGGSGMVAVALTIRF